MPKPKWDKRTISVYVPPEQKEVWEKIAKAERKAVAKFIRDRVESTINNKDHDGKTCIWLEIPKELYDKAETEDMDLSELVHKIIEGHATLKANNSELERQVGLLRVENESLRNRGGLSDSIAILKVLDNEKFMSLEQIAVRLNRDPDDQDDLHFLREEIENIGRIEYNGEGYRFNDEIKPVEREYPPRPELTLEVETK